MQPLLARVFDMPLKSQLAAPLPMTAPLYVSGHRVGVSICHELSFGATMAARAATSELLVNVADDNWIPNADYLEVMQRIARLRAAESGKPLVRVSNGAPAWWVDGRGHLAVLPGATDRPHVMNVVAPQGGRTPFHATVALQRALPLVLLLGAAGWSTWRRLQRSQVHS
jgi:apolipoprotein N-acyltransferase